MSEAAVLGIDIGGTKTLLALVRGAEVLDTLTLATRRDAGPEQWIADIAEGANRWRGRFDRAGAAVTGFVDGGLWSALNPGTLAIPPRWPLVARLEAALGVGVDAVNDAQAAAWGEYRHGAGRNEDMVFLTVSTGIGGGIVAGARLMTGVAGHFGLWPGEHGGLLEDGASGRWIAAEAGRQGHSIDTPQIFAAAGAGADWASLILDRSADRIALLCRRIQLAVGPARIVIGCGVGLAPGMIERLERRLAHLPHPFRPTLAVAALGALAGVVGAADRATLRA